MRSKPTVTEVARNFAAYVNRVAFHQDRFTLTRGGRPVAELTPVPMGKRLDELPRLLASLPRLGAEEAGALEADLAEARRSLGEIEARDPWAS
jgi:antitoxin (DNA-binding transcriptional repressor) of toxin-antitoxin stability system